MSLPDFHPPAPPPSSPGQGTYYVSPRRHPPAHPHNIALAVVIGAIVILGVGLAGFFLVIADDAETPSTEPEFDAAEALEEELTALENTYEACGESSDGIEVRDDGFTLIISRAVADEYPEASWKDLECVFNLIDLPAYIESHIGQTRALDGRQEAEFDNYQLSWSYHPDNGLNLTITDTTR